MHSVRFLQLFVAVAIVYWLPYNVVQEYTLCSPSGNIYTVNPEQPSVECILVRGSRIRDTGTLGL